jgi:hypothetical protein
VLRLFISTILFAITFNTQAQYSDLIGATEKQIKQRILAYYTIQKRKDDNEIVDVMTSRVKRKKFLILFGSSQGLTSVIS